MTLINEVGKEVPQVQQVDVLKQTAAAQQQRIVQTGTQYERAIAREAVVDYVGQGTMAGAYNAGVLAVKDATVQQTVVDRVNPVMTTELVNYAAAAPAVEYVGASAVRTAPVVEYGAAYGGAAYGGAAYGGTTGTMAAKVLSTGTTGYVAPTTGFGTATYATEVVAPTLY